MKKILSVIAMLLIFALVLASCGSDAVGDSGESSSEESSSEESSREESSSEESSSEKSSSSEESSSEKSSSETPSEPEPSSATVSEESSQSSEPTVEPTDEVPNTQPDIETPNLQVQIKVVRNSLNNDQVTVDVTDPDVSAQILAMIDGLTPANYDGPPVTGGFLYDVTITKDGATQIYSFSPTKDENGNCMIFIDGDMAPPPNNRYITNVAGAFEIIEGLF